MKILESKGSKDLKELLTTLSGTFELEFFDIHKCHNKEDGRKGIHIEIILGSREASDSKDEDPDHETNGHGEHNILKQLGFDL